MESSSLLVNRNGKKLTVSRKKAKFLAVNRKRHLPIETLIGEWEINGKEVFSSQKTTATPNGKR